jgi:DNA-binding NtrC family response regulator
MKDRYRFVISTSLHEAKAIIEANNEISVALVDLFLGDDYTRQPEGIEFLLWLAGEHPDIPAVVLTGQGNMDLAVDAMKAGAEDFIDKGRLNITELEKRILDIQERRKLRQENVLLRNRLDQYEARVLVGSSSVIGDLCRAHYSSPTR